jgi:GT2 family glycosyltransferase
VLAVSVIVPVHAGGAALAHCLAALSRLSPPPLEVIVVEDGGAYAGAPAYAAGVRVVRLPERRGPAAARNRGAAIARGDVFFFVDADVVVPATAVGAVQACLSDPALSAVIGSYDRWPAEPNFVSQFKNLAHRFVHQQAGDEGPTFWGACGAIRRKAFLSLGGFDERFDVPSIEDIELGLRLTRSGGHIRIQKDLEVTHLKRWTLTSLIRTDIRQRALPWSALLLGDGHIPNHLNVSRRARLAVALMAVLLAGLVATPFVPDAALVALNAGLVLLAVDWRLWAYFASERGWWFAVRAVPMQWLYYLYSGGAFAWVWLTGDWRRHRGTRVQEPA